MEYVRIQLRFAVAFALLRHNVQQYRSFGLLCKFQRFADLLQVMPVDGTKIFESQFFEQNSVDDRIFDRVPGMLHPGYHAFADERHFRNIFLYLSFHGDVLPRTAQSAQIVRQPSDVRGNGHSIVVEHDDDLRIEMGRIVEGFKSKPSCHGTVAYDGHYLVILSRKIPRSSKPQPQ